jgi:hypothetical protein
MTDRVAEANTSRLRYAVLGLTGLEVALFVFVQLDFLMRAASMDMLTRSMNQDFAILLCIPFAMLTLPALVLALKRRWLVLALILAILPVLMVLAVFVMFAAH